MKIKVLQFKPILGEVERNIKTVKEMMFNAVAESPDVIVLPELWSTGFYPEPIENFADKNGQNTCELLSAISKKYKINIVGGTTIVENDGQFYNRCFVFNRYGENIATYDKIHLFSMSGEDKVFTRGKNIPIFEIDGIKSSVAVCYDVRFPELIRKAALNDISILFLPAAWPLKRLSHWQILTRARAIENQIFIVAVNTAGHSAIIDPWGEVLAETEIGTEILDFDINFNVRADIKRRMAVFDDRRDFEIKTC